eukprot:snap_masked-scaffold_5-processed-gene-16.54-mRNA-1 protein AED:1.00 eAED:1.00 QI:0/-1/0/0/-1/1/1/0/756
MSFWIRQNLATAGSQYRRSLNESNELRTARKSILKSFKETVAKKASQRNMRRRSRTFLLSRFGGDAVQQDPMDKKLGTIPAHENIINREVSCTSLAQKVEPKHRIVDPQNKEITVPDTIEAMNAENVVDNIQKEIRKSETILSTLDLKKEAAQKMLVFPNSRGKKAWDVVVFILVILKCLIDPYQLAFLNKELTDRTAFSLVTETVFGLDIIICFQTVIYNNTGDPILGRWEIARTYFQFWFWVDIISMSSFFFSFFLPENSMEPRSPEGILLELLFLLKVTRVPRILGRFSKMTEVNPKNVSTLTRAVTIVTMFHWTACFYWFASTVMAKDNLYYSLPSNQLQDILDNLSKVPDGVSLYIQEWLPPREVLFLNTSDDVHNNVVNRYYLSLFWSIMVTTGSGRDIKPTTESEYLVSIFCILCGLLIFAYIVSGVTSFLNTEDEDEKELRRAIQSCEKFFTVHSSIPHAQRMRVKDWYYFSHMRKGYGSLKFKELLGNLPPALGLEVKLFFRRNIIETLPICSLIPDSMCLIDFVDSLESRLFVPGEIIYGVADTPEFLYVLTEGKLVEVKREKSTAQRLIQRFIKPVEMFGAKEMLLHRSRESCITSCTFGEVLTLRKQQYDLLMKKHSYFFDALTSSVFKSVAIGWEKIRILIKIVSTGRLFGVSTSGVSEKLIQVGQSLVPENSILNQNKIYENDGQVYQHFAYREARVRKQTYVKNMLTQKGKQKETALYRRHSVVSKKRQMQTLAKKMKKGA